MADNTPIEWTDATWNPITGCSVVSPGCTNCYAMKLAGGRLRNHPSRQGLTKDSKAGPVWTGEVRFNEAELLRPLRWRRPRKIFVCAHGDLFHEDVPDAWIDRVFAVMAMAPQHTFQVLTKRAARMRAYFEARREGDPWAEAADDVADALGQVEHPAVLEPRDLPLPNVWLGVSAEDQARADERIPDLLATPAAVRFLSAEPLLGPIDLYSAWHGEGALAAECWGECGWCPNGHPPLHNCQQGRPSLYEDREHSGLDWVIVGGESGPGARPMHPGWAREIRDQCAEAGVAFHFKQWGAWREFGHVQDGPDVHEVDVGSEEAASILPLVPPTRRAFLTTDGRCFRTATAIPPDTPARLMERLGKKAAGRLLDGVTHDGFPEAR